MENDNKKNHEERRKSFMEGVNSNLTIQERLSNLNSSVKEEKKEQNPIPGKIDIKRHSLKMEGTLTSSKNCQDEPIKIPPKKISDDYFEKLENENNKFQEERKKSVILISGKQIQERLLNLNSSIKEENIDENPIPGKIY